MTTQIYHARHKGRVAENVFVDELQRHLAPCQLICENWRFGESDLNRFVSRDRLLSALGRDHSLPEKKRQRAIDQLEVLPTSLKVAMASPRISCDAVVVRSGEPIHYFEFHESQHRRLTVSRPGLVYSPSGEEYRTPRFVQRLIRDCWRVEHLRPYTIVWSDWFEEHRETYRPMLNDGFTEHALPLKFSFANFFC